MSQAMGKRELDAPRDTLYQCKSKYDNGSPTTHFMCNYSKFAKDHRQSFTLSIYVACIMYGFTIIMLHRHTDQ